jgi:NAD(P)-dependent dehydrogenase (short-subunit alcohol dehydrogenase family)
MTRLTTPFGFHSTAEDVIQGVDLSGKRVIVTGASSGIGVETARALAKAGADVTLAVRRLDAGERVAADIMETTSARDVKVAALDLADLASIEAFIAGWSAPLHILVNNAGIMALPKLEQTRNGWEMQFATNFLGHFALAVGLYPALATAKGARIVSVSSSANMIAPVIFDDPHFNFLPYDPFVAYGQSKTACALFAIEATRRWSKDAIFANALNPGAIENQPAAAYGRHEDSAGKAQVRSTGGGNFRFSCVIAIAEWRRWQIFRGLQRGRRRPETANGLRRRIRSVRNGRRQRGAGLASGREIAEMIRCVRMWTGPDGHSTFEEGEMMLAQGMRGRASGLPIDARELSFLETDAELDGSWHPAPTPQFVLR